MIVIVVIIAFMYLGIKYSRPSNREENHDPEEGRPMVVLNNNAEGGTEEKGQRMTTRDQWLQLTSGEHQTTYLWHLYR